MGAVGPFPFVSILKSGVMAIDLAQELLMGSRAIARRVSTAIFQGKNGSMSDGAWPPFSAQRTRYHVSQVRMLGFAGRKLANREKSVAASRPLHNALEP